MARYKSSDTEKLLKATIKQLGKADTELSGKLKNALKVTEQYHTEINKLFTKRIEIRKGTIESSNQKKEETEKQLKKDLDKLLNTKKTGYHDIDSLNEKNITITQNWISINETNNKVTNSFIEKANKIDAEFNNWYSGMVYFAAKSVHDDSRFDAIVRLVSGGTLIALGLTGNIAIGAGAAILSAITLYKSEKVNFGKGKLSKLELEIRRYKTALLIVENINNMSVGWIKLLSI